jgi:ATP synthase protein I
MSNLKPPPVHKVIVAQIAATGLIAVISLLISGSITAYSVFLGGLISALPNSYFAMQAFRYQGARSADKVVKSFLRGELGKMGLTLVLFALCFSLIGNVNEIALILGFIVIQFVGVIMSGFIGYTPTGNKT